jgi:hypothetical protein
MKLTAPEQRAIQVNFWVAALRGAYDNMYPWWVTLSLQMPRLSERKIKAHGAAIAEVGRGVVLEIMDAIPAEIKKDVIRAYRKSIKEKP